MSNTPRGVDETPLQDGVGLSGKGSKGEGRDEWRSPGWEVWGSVRRGVYGGREPSGPPFFRHRWAVSGFTSRGRHRAVLGVPRPQPGNGVGVHVPTWAARGMVCRTGAGCPTKTRTVSRPSTAPGGPLRRVIGPRCAGDAVTATRTGHGLTGVSATRGVPSTLSR